MNEFDYAAVATVDEAVSLLAARGDRAKVLAGGTDLLVQLREGLRQADLVVDVKRIPELTQFRCDAKNGLVLGAAVTAYQIYTDKQIPKLYPALADSARIIGGWQIQSRASLGGNLCNASPAADSIPAIIAEGGTCVIAGPLGIRRLPAEQFCVSPGKTALGKGEFLVSLEFPAPAAHGSSHYLRFIPRNEMDIAVAGAGVRVTLDSAGKHFVSGRIALSAVAPTPLFAQAASQSLAGKPVGTDAISAAAKLAREIAKPISDMRGTTEFRTHLVEVLVTRALEKAVARATGKE